MNSSRTRFTPARLLNSPTVTVIAALAIRLLVLVLSHHYEDRAHNTFMSWGMESFMVGKSLATGYGFSHPFPHYAFTTAWLAPVYPWLLSWGFLLFRLEGHPIVIFGQILNILFSGLTCYPIYYLGKTVFNRGVGIAAAWLWVLFPVAILMPIEWVWDQSLSALLLACLLCFTFWLRDSSSPLHWSGYGLLWGIAALTNPTLCLLLPFLSIWLWAQRWKRGISSGTLVARFALFFVLALLPWTLRNWLEFGHFIFVKSNFGVELWLGNNPDVKDVYSHQHHPMEDYREYTILFIAGEPVYSQMKQEQAVSFIKANPGTFLKLCWNRFVDTWTGNYDSPHGTYVKTIGLLNAYIWMTGLYSLAAFVGLLVAFQKDAMESLPLAFSLLLFPIPYYFTHSSLRYRHPIDPVVTLLVVVAVARLIAPLNSRGAVHQASPTEAEEEHLVHV